MGRAIAEEFAARGFDLVLTYHRSRADIARLAERLQEQGANVRLVSLNLDKPASVVSAAQRLNRQLPRLDVLVHNAAAYAPTPLRSLKASDVLAFYRVNALAPLLLSQALADKLQKSPLPHGGSIVAMLDIHALGRPRRDHVAYSMSKAALAEMVRSLARELAPRVRVNGVAPGVVAWPQGGPESSGAFQEAYIRRVPLARAGTPQDAAQTVRWLALEAGYITGEIVRLDGGRWLA